MTQRRLLIVDDSPSVRSIVKVFLSGSEFEISEAADVQRALALASIQRPHVILADFNMPGRTGVELFRDVRAKGMKDVALVLLTASKEVGLTEQAKAAGADECLSKPIDPKALREAIARALQAHAVVTAR